MSTPPEAAVIPADPVLDGEMIDNDDRATGQRQGSRRAASWWQRSPRVPAALKSWANASQAGKDAVVVAARAPWRFVGAAGRGTVLAGRAWRHWVSVRDYRAAAEQSEKLADKYVEIRELTLFRWRVTGAVTGTGVAGVAVADMLYGLTRVVDHSRDRRGRAGDRPGGARMAAQVGGRCSPGPRSLTWTMDPQILVDAFRDAKLIGKDESLRLVERATRIGERAGRSPSTCPRPARPLTSIKNREALASALAVDEVQLIVERVRGNGGHAGRVAMWVADGTRTRRHRYATPLLPVRALGRMAAGALRTRRPGPRRPAARVDLAPGGCDPAPGQNLRHPPPGRRPDPRPAHPPLHLRREGRQGLEGRGGGRLPVRLRRRERTRGSWPGRPDRVGRRDPGAVRCGCPNWTTWSAPNRKLRQRSPEIRSWVCQSPRCSLTRCKSSWKNATKQEVGERKTTLGGYIGELLTYLAKKGPAAGIVIVSSLPSVPTSRRSPQRSVLYSGRGSHCG